MELITEVGFLDDYVNDVTLMMDEYTTSKCKYFVNYIACNQRVRSRWALRYPGATRGHISVDDNNMIKDIVIYEITDTIYREGMRESLKKFIGYKLIFNSNK